MIKQSSRLSSKSKSVTLVGEVLIDIIKDPASNFTKIIVGGSPYNITKNLTKLGIHNKFFGSVGKDPYGTLVLDEVKKQQINAHISVVDYPTTYVTLNQTSSSPIPTFHRGSDNFISLSESMIQAVEHSSILHFTFWPLAKDPSKSTILSLVKKARRNQTLIGFDPNYHVLLDDKSFSGLETLKEVIALVDIIKPSIDDSLRMFGEHTVIEYLDIYESLGAKTIIMTLGPDGLIAKHKGKVIQLPSLADELVDSTGAGDAFWSGLYCGIVHDLRFEQCLTLGLKCSAMNLKTIGADMDLPNAKDLINMLGE